MSLTVIRIQLCNRSGGRIVVIVLEISMTMTSTMTELARLNGYEKYSVW
jgi:hypothetical protein